MQQILCDYCSKLSFQVTDPPKVTYYRHQPSIRALKSSAQAGCELCSHISGCLSLAEKPKLEGKRSQQVWIKICPSCTPEEMERYGLLGESMRVFCGHDSLEWQDLEAKADCYLDIATAGSNALPIKGKLITANPASSSILEIIQAWLQECDSNHAKCRPLRSPELPTPPTRLIDVGTTISPLTRLIPTSPSELPIYTALSYCWGIGQTLTTTRANLPTHQQEIPFQLLPKTIQDAITITRSLNIPYLWVDALCILQDANNTEDFERESANMGSIYGNAYFTIAAESSENCADGFLHRRETGRANPLWEISVRLPNGEVSGSAFICAAVPDEKKFLMRRAWAFQEQRLSRKVLHYRARGLDLCCREGTWPESIPFTCSPDPQYQEFQSIRPINITSRSQMENHRDWLRSIEVYSGRSMTKAGDKLPAISGYAHEVHKAIDGTYLAGLWERYIAFDLLWIPHRNGEGQSISKRRRAPSWSWSSVDGQISYFWPLNRITESSLQEPQIKILDHKITLIGLDPMGEVSRGELELSGYLKRVSWLPPPSRRSGVTITSSDTWYRVPEFEWSPLEGGKCLFDCPDQDIPDGLWCLVVSTEVKAVNCLVLGQEEKGNIFQRVGFARIRRVKDIAALLRTFQVSVIKLI